MRLKKLRNPRKYNKRRRRQRKRVKKIMAQNFPELIQDDNDDDGVKLDRVISILEDRARMATTANTLRDAIFKDPVRSFNNQVEKFSNDTTLHGLSYVLSSVSKLGKLFWTLALISVVVVVTMQLHKLIAYFMTNPTVTSIDVVYPEEGLPFPSLTVCILSKLNKTAIETNYPKMPKHIAEFSMASFISAYSTALMDIGYFYRQNLKVSEMQKEFDEHIGNKTTLEFLEEASFTCRNQFLLCWFENGHIFDCCDPHVPMRVKRWLLHSGPCFEFQYDNLLQRLPGPVGGLGFAYWYPNKDLFPSVFNSYDEHAVHLFTSPTDAMLEKNPIVLPVGSHVHISLTATKVTRLMTDQLGRTTCVEQNLKFFNYTYASCQAECLIDNMLRLCNCTGITTYGKVPQGQVCSPARALKCYEKLAYDFTDILANCRKEQCKEACSYWSYSASQTVGKVFNPVLKRKMIDYWRLPNTSDPGLSLIFADIYFNDIEYTDVRQMPAFNIETFISAVGGAMGLWTGASIITWIHLVYFCLARMNFWKKRNLCFKKIDTSSPSRTPPQASKNGKVSSQNGAVLRRSSSDLSLDHKSRLLGHDTASNMREKT